MGEQQVFHPAIAAEEENERIPCKHEYNGTSDSQRSVLEQCRDRKGESDNHQQMDGFKPVDLKKMQQNGAFLDFAVRYVQIRGKGFIESEFKPSNQYGDRQIVESAGKPRT